jgi:hypothetical protein
MRGVPVPTTYRQEVRVKKFAAAIVLLATVSLSGCYHATVDTGLAPSGQTIQEAWAPGFLWGLVGPPTVETAARCPAGVARVDTRHSFLNQLVMGLTFGLFTPMQIDVQCAAASGMIPDSEPAVAVAVHADDDAIRAALTEAATLSARTKAPVWVLYTE